MGSFIIPRKTFHGIGSIENLKEVKGKKVVPTKQCGSIISMSYISYLLAAHSEKSGVYKVKQGSIPKPALLCRDYR